MAGLFLHNEDRRGFLQRAMTLGAALASLPRRRVEPPPQKITGRVASAAIYIYDEPSFDGKRLGMLYRDQLLALMGEFQSSNGPAHNPLWYRIEEGYVHSGLIQRIPYHLPNAPVVALPEGGMLAQVTVPYTRSFYSPGGRSFQPLYRLYYESTHWVRAVIEDLDGRYWYRLYDPKIEGQYLAPAADLRPVLPEEFAPTGRDVPAEAKRIQVNIDEQTLTAFEGETVVLQTTMASGVPNRADLAPGELPTDTPRGYWRITLKMPSRHMGDGHWTSQVDAYELPGVPWTMAFHKDGYALHGSYWHNNFGRRMSHGCVNLRNTDALWLFRWSDPPYETNDWYVKGLGTLVQVI